MTTTNSIPCNRDLIPRKTKSASTKGLISFEDMPLHHSRSSQNGPPPNKRDHQKAKRDQVKKQHQQQSKEEPEVIIDPLPKFDINEVGPHPGLIEPCRAYVFEHRIQECLKKLGTEMKDENWRITGVNLIAQMMKTLGL